MRFKPPESEGKWSSAVEARFRWQAEVDPLGRRIHLIVAVVWCVLLAGPVTVAELGILPLAVCFLIRIDKGMWTLWPIVRQPLVWLILGWYGWMALSLLWTPNLRQGLDELSGIRWLVLLPLLWPVMDRRHVLIVALAAGFILANFSQVAHIASGPLGFEWPFDRMPGRKSGWLAPVIGASMLVAALGLHLPEALMGPNRHPSLTGPAGESPARTRLPGILGCLITLPAIFVTGTRGAWITAPTLIAVSTVYALARVRPVQRLLVALAVIGIGAAAGAAGAWLVVGDQLRARAELGVTEVREALREGDYDSDTGARLLMWRAALDTVARRPLTGIGAGGFRQAQAAFDERNEIPKGGERRHDHAHSLSLHLLATLGVPGLILAGAVVGAGLHGGLRGPEEQRAGYGLAPAFALAGLVIAGVFDTVYVSTQSTALLFTLLTLCYPGRPRLERARKLAERESGEDGGAADREGGAGGGSGPA